MNEFDLLVFDFKEDTCLMSLKPPLLSHEESETFIFKSTNEFLLISFLS